MNQKAEQKKNWFALYVKPKHEFKARDELGQYQYSKLPACSHTSTSME